MAASILSLFNDIGIRSSTYIDMPIRYHFQQNCGRVSAPGLRKQRRLERNIQLRAQRRQRRKPAKRRILPLVVERPTLSVRSAHATALVPGLGQ